MARQQDAKIRAKHRRQGYILILSIAIPIIIYVSLHMGYVQESSGENIAEVCMKALMHMTEKPLVMFPNSSYSLRYMGIMLLILIIGVLMASVNAKMEDADKDASGTAHWNEDMASFNRKFNEPFGNAKKTDGYSNMILADNLRLSMLGKTRRNAHQAIFGGSGTGKSYTIIKPNALQMNCSMIFTDPKGELLEELAVPLENNGYEIKVFNLSQMNKSMRYNPLSYIRDENGVRSMVKCIIDNTRGTEEKSGDPIWEDSMTALLQAIVYYMLEEVENPRERNFENIMKMLRLAQIDENNTSSKSTFDLIFEDLAEKNPESMAVKSYRTFRIGSGNTLKSILITTMSRLDVFNIPAVANLTAYDTLHLEEIGKKRQALFIIIPAADKTYNFLAATLYTQLFETLYYQVENELPHTYQLQNGHDTYLCCKSKEEVEIKKALIPDSVIEYDSETERYNLLCSEKKILIESFTTQKAAEWYKAHATGKIVKGKRTLPYDVRMMLDEFANIGKIPGFVEKLSTMRSYKISCTIILQNLSQLKKLHGDDMGTIIGNCDTFIFLGSQEKDMIEYVESFLSKTTKRQKSSSISRGKGGNSSSYQFTAASLLAFNEIREMDEDDSIIFIRGLKPFYSRKFNLANHPMYKKSGAYSDDFKYAITLDNRKKVNEDRDERIIEEEKEKTYAKELEKGDEQVISMPIDIVNIFGKICEGDMSNLADMIEFDDDSDGKVAETEEEKKIAAENFEDAENMAKPKKKEDKYDLWEAMSDMML